MWIVRVALHRPYTFIVLALLIVLLGVYSYLRTPIDIFPDIDLPVAAVIWHYNGLSPREIADRIVLFSERVAQTVVNDVQHTESQSVDGVAVVKYFFQPGANRDLSYAQIAAVSQAQLFNSPPGTSPPFILSYNASSVPILQLALSSNTLSESRLYDLANNVLRTDLATVAGASIPFPYGGKQREVSVDLDPAALRAHGLTPADVSAAIAAQNLILPAGTEKIGSREYFVGLNASPRRIDRLNDLPIRSSNGSVTYVRDVAHVRDGYSPQTNIVRLNGRRAVLMSVLKTGKASTIAIIDAIDAKLPQIRASLPRSLTIAPLGDQSIFVRAAVSGVIREAVIAAALTGLLILLFLGSWRSTLIITISIPLSILASITCLAALGQTINIMTLGGLALAVGILVDDATVTIENINWHLENGKDVEAAILDGARQIALPALVSTLSICIVFLPMFLLAGIAKYLFIPLAEAVVFAMLASYLLSRTLVPTLAKFWLRARDAHPAGVSRHPLARLHHGFERRFERLRERYRVLLGASLHSGPRFVALFLAAIAATALLAFPLGPLPGLGQDFFPTVDAGQIKLHLRAPTGTRIEDTAALCDAVEATIRRVIPRGQIASIVDNIGLPYSGINLAYSTSAPVGPGDADIFVNLRSRHTPVARLVRELRPVLDARYPSTTFSFLPADMISQILNFGVPSPIDVRITGFNDAGDRAFANHLLERLRTVPGAVDLRIQQPDDYPQIQVHVDRTKAQLLGLTERDVANNLLVSLSGSFQTSPSFWIDPRTGTQYQVAVQTPQFLMHSLGDLADTPIGPPPPGGGPPLLADVATFRRTMVPAVVTHYDAKPSIDIFGSVQGTDLGYVAARIRRIVDAARKSLPRGSQVTLSGQVATMRASFDGLTLGLLAAIALVYLLLVVNFQSVLDPFIIITALPAALAGIVWMLFLTDTTVTVPVLTGAIMAMGVATANSVLVVSFARERMNAGDDAYEAAIAAGVTRLRPVMMTALAMIIGMVPMALGLGAGGEQNAPLGRAVIGGLAFATVATLFFVPTVFVIVHGRARAAGAVPVETLDA